MRTRPLGQSRIEASVIGLGTWAIGGWPWGGTNEREAVDAIRAAIDDGINLIDTAPAYGLGLAEELTGKAIAGRRNKVVLATKCGLVWNVHKGRHACDELGKPVHSYLGPESIQHEIEQSLRRLGTDYIDLYQTHVPDPTTPIEATMSALLKLKEQGKIRAIGVSNVTVDQIQEYQKLGPIDTDQEKYSMIDRGIEESLVPVCRNHNIAILAYSPLAKGLLSGKVGPERVFPPTDLRYRDPQFSVDSRKAVMEMLNSFRPVADGHGLTFAQTVIAWTVAQPGITHALVGARNPHQAHENARAGDIVLSPDELARINDAVGRYFAVV